VIDAASPVRSSSGIVAIADWTPSALSDLFDPPPALALGLLDVQEPGNVGAVVRSADALGGTGVAALDRTANPSGWKALRGAMGSTFRLPVARASFEEALVTARRSGARVLAAVAAGARPLTETDLRRPILVLLGNEGAGLPEAVVNQADEQVTIPMRPGVSSLNVAVTAAVIVYEARRQRGN
jgi:TrmH family RNA methyltransferase